MTKKYVTYVTSIFCAFALLVNIPLPANAIEDTVSIETKNEPELVLTQASIDFMTRMFEKEGYTILESDGTNVTERFYADMTIEFEYRNFDIISDYLFDNNLTVYGPAELTDIDESVSVLRDPAIYEEKGIYRDGTMVIENTMGPGSQKFVWMLSSAVTYDNQAGKFVSATGPFMQYAPWYEIYDEYSYKENKDKTVGKPYSDSVGFSFEVDIFAYEYYDEGWVSRFHGVLSDRCTLTYSEFVEEKS